MYEVRADMAMKTDRDCARRLTKGIAYIRSLESSSEPPGPDGSITLARSLASVSRSASSCMGSRVPVTARPTMPVTGRS